MKHAGRGDAPAGRLLVLSLWQPWASLCVLPCELTGGKPCKPHETRDWKPRKSTPFPVLIHATASWKPDATDVCAIPIVTSALDSLGFSPRWSRGAGHNRVMPPRMPMGKLVGVALVDMVMPADNAIDAMNIAYGDDSPTYQLAAALGWHAPDRWAFNLAHPFAFAEPIPMRGRQDVLWPIDAELQRRILRMMPTDHPLVRNGHLAWE